MPAFFDRLGLRSSMKAALIIVLLLLLLIPLGMIGDLVWERESRSDSAAAEIIGSAGGHLDIIGPVVILPYDVVERVYREGNWIREQKPGGEVFAAPEEVGIRIDLKTEYRVRGIYRVPVYEARLDIDGVIPALDSDFLPEGAILRSEGIRIFTGFGDMRGIKAISSLTLGDRQFEFRPESAGENLGGGIAVYPAGVDLYSAPIEFSWDMELSGGGRVTATPLGRDSRLEISGDWPSPSFGGAVLPRDRQVSEKGFSAVWVIPEVSRPIGSHWKSGDAPLYSLRSHALEVRLMEPVGTYTRARRSVKYGALFLLLPFVVFFLFEAFGKARIHPVQYLLAGAADVLFYMLLLAVSEHLGFDFAYLIAAAASTVLLSLYSLQFTGRSPRGLVMPLVLGGAYLWLWVTLQSEDYALLIGAVGLFALVALVMTVTGKVNWYRTSGDGNLGAEGQEGQPGQFEVLPSEGNADDGDGEKASQKDMPDSQLPSEQDDPDDIADGPGGSEVADHHIPAEGPQDE